MALQAEVGEIKNEFRSIERLIKELLQWQSELCSRLTCLEPVGSQRPFSSATVSPRSPAWSYVVNGRKRFSLPLCDWSAVGGDDIPLSNFFSPLAGHPLKLLLSHHIACPWSGRGAAYPVGHQKTSHLPHIVVPFISPSRIQTSPPVPPAEP